MKYALLPWVLGAALSLIGCSKEASAPDAGTSSESKATANGAAPISGDGFAPKLCSVLEKIAPEVRPMAPVGAQAQLVMGIANAFDTNAVALGRVSAEIDVVASASCAAARESLLATVKMQSLQEAVR